MTEQQPMCCLFFFKDRIVLLLSLCTWNQFSSVQLLHCVWLIVTPWTAACQAFLSITNSRSLLKLISIELVMPSKRLILCCPLLLPPSIFPSIRVFSNKSVLCIRWPKYWSFSFSISPSNEYSGLISFRMDWLDLLAVQGTLKSLFQHQVQKHQFFGTQVSLWSSSHIHTWLLEKPKLWLDGPEPRRVIWLAWSVRGGQCGWREECTLFGFQDT